jgi:hypothetical protein
MLGLDDPRWATLSHAYGRAGGIPALLRNARQDFRPGHLQESTWFDLWSALCHQGDAYTASYAAVPHLVALASDHLDRQRYDPLFLTACIELARLEGRGPQVPSELAASYQDAVEEARVLAETNLPRAWDADAEAAIRASAAALAGNAVGARALLDADDEAE